MECDPGLDGGKDATMFVDILNMVSGCVDNLSPDRFVTSLNLLIIVMSMSNYYGSIYVTYALIKCSTVLQVLKVLLTAVSSTKFRGNVGG